MGTTIWSDDDEEFLDKLNDALGDLEPEDVPPIPHERHPPDGSHFPPMGTTYLHVYHHPEKDIYDCWYNDLHVFWLLSGYKIAGCVEFPYNMRQDGAFEWLVSHRDEAIDLLSTVVDEQTAERIHDRIQSRHGS